MSERFYVFGPDNNDGIADAIFTCKKDRDDYVRLRKAMTEYGVDNIDDLIEMVEFHRGPLLK